MKISGILIFGLIVASPFIWREVSAELAVRRRSARNFAEGKQELFSQEVRLMRRRQEQRAKDEARENRVYRKLALSKRRRGAG